MTERRSYTSVFAVRTTAGQERNVAELLASKIEANKIPIKSIVVPETLKGYIFIEAEGPHIVEEAIAGIKHIRSRVQGKVDVSELETKLLKRVSVAFISSILKKELELFPSKKP